MLRELQSAMGKALLDGPTESAAAHILADGLTAEARLAIYRHHVFITLTAALQTTYPVLCRLVHERFFGYAADQYIRATRRPGLACSSTEARSQHSSPASSPAGICSTCPTWRGSNGR
jgi:hypothetical protein